MRDRKDELEEQEDMEEFNFILKLIDFNDESTEWGKILRISGEEKKHVELNRKGSNIAFKKRKSHSRHRQSTRVLIEKFPIWEK